VPPCTIRSPSCPGPRHPVEPSNKNAGARPLTGYYAAVGERHRGSSGFCARAERENCRTRGLDPDKVRELCSPPAVTDIKLRFDLLEARAA